MIQLLSLQKPACLHRKPTRTSLNGGRVSRWRFACATETAPEQVIYAGGKDEALVDVEIVGAGRLVIKPIQAADVEAATFLLTKVFAGTPEYTNLKDAKEYMEDIIDLPPDAVLLVARLYPDENSQIKVAPDQTSRVVGLAAMSYTDDTRDDCDHLPAPPSSAYLTNMAVDPKCRRLGVGRHLLAACYAATRAMAPQLDTVYLHTLLSNESATAFYSAEGFTTIAEDSFLVRLRNITPVRLMEKKFC